jgi:adenosine deaminase
MSSNTSSLGGSSWSTIMWNKIQGEVSDIEERSPGASRRPSLTNSNHSDKSSISPSSRDSRLNDDGIPPSFLLKGSLYGETFKKALKIHKEVASIFDTMRSEDDISSFFKKMPKGADLHLHVTGSIYPQDIIQLAIDRALFIDPKTHTCFQKEVEGALKVQEFVSSRIDKALWVSLLCMEGEGNSLKGKTRFFEACKYGEKVLGFIPFYQQLAYVVKEAKAESNLYLEVMMEWIPERPEVSFNEEFQANYLRSDLNLFLGQIHKKLEVSLNPLIENLYLKVKNDLDLADVNVPSLAGLETKDPITSIKSEVVVRYILEINRNQSPYPFFMDALAAYSLAQKEPERIVGINLVGPEDEVYSLTTYDFQIGVLDYLTNTFKKEEKHLTIHAGELDPYSNATYKVTERIKKLVTKLKGLKRIGHGFSVHHESNDIYSLLLNNQITIEACPSSSEAILNRLPPYFLEGMSKQLMPAVTLNTDDQGITLKSLSAQYLAVYKTKNFKYRHFIRMNRSSLEASFLKGESLYEKEVGGTYLKVKECFKKFLENSDTEKEKDLSEKAFIQLKFERKLIEFEEKFFEEYSKSVLSSPLSPCALSQSMPILKN